MAAKSKLFLFTFTPADRSDSIVMGERQTIMVAAKDYPLAVEEVLNLKLPNILKESDVKWLKVAEDYPEEDDLILEHEDRDDDED